MKLYKEQTAIILQKFGYEINKFFKFKIRPENTASASINPKDGKIKDFGSGWHGDIVDFLVEFENLSKRDAFLKVESILELNLNFKPQKIIQTKKTTFNFISKNIIDKFQIERKENFVRFWQLLSQILPSSSQEIKRIIAKKYEIGYSKNADRLIMPIKDENGNCLTFWKYNKFPNPVYDNFGREIILPKVMFSKDRPRCPFDLQTLKNYSKSKTIMILEGEKDCLNALASGIQGVSLGSSSSKIYEKYFKFFADFNVLIAYDFDKSGTSGALNLQEQLKEICKNIQIIDWQKSLKFLGLENKIKKGFDFTDFLLLLKENKILLNKVRFYC